MDANLLKLFSPTLQALPSFANLARVLDTSPTIIQLLYDFTLAPGLAHMIDSDPALTGTFTSVDGIHLDARVLETLAEPGGMSYTTLASLLAHELGHATSPRGNLFPEGQAREAYDRANNPNEAAALGLALEAPAILQAYRVAAELGAVMAGGIELQNQLDVLARQTGGIGSPAFNEQAFGVAVQYAANQHPSTAPKLNYEQYYKYYWAVAKCGIETKTVDWKNAVPQDFHYNNNDNGTCTLNGSHIPLLGGGYFSGRVQFDEHGNILVSLSELHGADGHVSIDLSGAQTLDVNGADIFVHQAPLQDPHDFATHELVTIIGQNNNVIAFGGAYLQFFGDRNNIAGGDYASVVGNGSQNQIIQTGEHFHVTMNSSPVIINRNLDWIDQAFDFFGYRPEVNPANNKEHRLENWPGPNFRLLPQSANSIELHLFIQQSEHHDAIQLIGVHTSLV